MKMNAKYRRVPTRFGPDTRFEVRPAPPAPFRGVQETELDRLKDRLLLGRLQGVYERNTALYLRRAANEAAALAWVTPYPLLVFPGLFEEKITAALLQADRQKDVRRRSIQLLAV